MIEETTDASCPICGLENEWMPSVSEDGIWRFVKCPLHTPNEEENHED